MSFRACLCVTLLVTVVALKIPKPEKKRLYVWSEDALDDGLVEYKSENHFATVSLRRKSKFNEELEEDDEGASTNGNVIIHKQLKLALCYFPKVASAETNSMFNNMNGLNHDEFVKHVFGASSPKKLGVDVKDMTKQNGWLFGFLTRDPLSRFLSAFGSKCLPKDDGSPGDVRYCAGTVGETEKDGWSIVSHPVEEEEAVQAFERHVVHFEETLYQENGSLATNNQHYMRMVDLIENCGTDLFAPDKVDFIGHLNGPVHRQVEDFIYMGIERQKRKKVSEEVENCFTNPVLGRSPGSNIGNSTETSVEDCMLKCKAQKDCLAMTLRLSDGLCNLLDRKYEGKYEESSDRLLANKLHKCDVSSKKKATWCQNGVMSEHGKTCCALSCGSCGGSGCSSRPGGSSQCCNAANSTCTSVEQVACEVPLVKVRNAQIDLVQNMVNTTAIDFFLSKFFPSGSSHGHSSSHDPSIFYRNKTIAGMVHRMYKEDYKTLGQAYPGDREYYDGPRP